MPCRIEKLRQNPCINNSVWLSKCGIPTMCQELLQALFRVECDQIFPIDDVPKDMKRQPQQIQKVVMQESWMLEAMDMKRDESHTQETICLVNTILKYFYKVASKEVISHIMKAECSFEEKQFLCLPWIILQLGIAAISLFQLFPPCLPFPSC